MPSKKLLIVEDDPKSLYAIHAVLQAHGFEVVACDSAEQALSHDGVRFAAAIVDVRLPKMQGVEFARQLLQTHPSTRIIFVTAYNGILHLEAAVPGSAVLPKPIDVDLLLTLL